MAAQPRLSRGQPCRRSEVGESEEAESEEAESEETEPEEAVSEEVGQGGAWLCYNS